MTLSLASPTWNSLVSEKSLKALNGLRGGFRQLGVRLALGKLEGASRELRRASDRLPHASTYLEKQFLQFQETLEQLATASRDLIAHGHKVVTMASGQEMGEVSFEGVFALLEGPLEYLAGTQEAMDELAHGLRASLEAISRLLASERALEATVAPLEITQVMFRIQSAYLPSEHRQVFNAVTDEIVTLQGQIQSAFSEHVRVLSGVHENLLAAVEALELEMATQGRKVREKRAALARYLESLLSEIKSNAERDVELTGASRELGEKVSQAVVTLQTQDIVAQKLQHAQSGIADVVGALDRCEAENDSECFARVAAITRVETAQLDSVIAELENSDGALREVLGGIAALLEKLNGGTLLLTEFSEMTASASGSIQGLLDSLEEIREMVAATLRATEMAEKSVLPVRTATEGLTNTVQAVAHEMHLIALNAQIQSIQMGEGTGLDVLAAHSTEVSQATTRISMEVTEKVSEVAIAVAAHSDRLSGLRQAGQAQQAELEQKGQLQEAALHRVRDQTLNEFRATSEALENARKLGAGIGGLLNVAPAVAEIQAVRESVADLHERSTAIGKAFALPAGRQVNLASLEGKYTMASERRIHSEVLGAPVGVAPGSAASGGTVDLWDDGPEASEEQVAPSEAANVHGAPPTDFAALLGEGEFGAGVDLF